MPRKYIFDASTLILLAKITVLRSFAQITTTIITTVVRAEVLAKKEAEDAKIIERLLTEGIIQGSTEKIQMTPFIENLALGRGEAEALNLAFKRKQILATDDWCAIKACKIVDVKFVTAIHCLLYLVRKEVLDKRLALEKLKRLDEYGRYSLEIMKDARKRIEGENNG